MKNKMLMIFGVWENLDVVLIKFMCKRRYLFIVMYIIYIKCFKGWKIKLERLFK